MDTTEKLKTLFAEGKVDEARSLIKEIVDAPLSPEEEGEMLVSLAKAYLEATNAADAAYIEALEKLAEKQKQS